MLEEVYGTGENIIPTPEQYRQYLIEDASYDYPYQYHLKSEFSEAEEGEEKSLILSYIIPLVGIIIAFQTAYRAGKKDDDENSANSVDNNQIDKE